MSQASRRAFLKAAGAATLAGAGPLLCVQSAFARETDANEEVQSMQKISGVNNQPVELTFTSEKKHLDPFRDIQLDVVVTDAGRRTRTIPAFWAGGRDWKARFSSDQPGVYSYRSVCNDSGDVGLHAKVGVVELAAYRGSNPLLLHGPVRVAKDKLHFEHTDGTPFFWLGDTWWVELCKRLRWPGDFKALTADRVKKGYTVVQITSGLNPEDTGGGAPPFDRRSMNEAGYPGRMNTQQSIPDTSTSLINVSST